MIKQGSINKTHEDYAEMMTAMNNIIKAVNDAKDLLMRQNPTCAYEAVRCLRNIIGEAGNINAAIARDYIAELEAKQNN